MKVNIVWSIIWAVVAILAIVAFWWKPAVWIITGVALIMCAMYVREHKITGE